MGNKDSGLYSCGVPQLICLYPTDRFRGSVDSVPQVQSSVRVIRRVCASCLSIGSLNHLPSCIVERRGQHALPQVAGLGISQQKLGDILVLESRLIQTSERYKISPHQQREHLHA